MTVIHRCAKCTKSKSKTKFDNDSDNLKNLMMIEYALILIAYKQLH